MLKSERNRGTRDSSDDAFPGAPLSGPPMVSSCLGRYVLTSRHRLNLPKISIKRIRLSDLLHEGRRGLGAV